MNWQHINDQVNVIINQVQVATASVKRHPAGHAFLWGDVTVVQKNGKPKVFRTCLGSVCTEDLDEVVRITNSIPGVAAAATASIDSVARWLHPRALRTRPVDGAAVNSILLSLAMDEGLRAGFASKVRELFQGSCKLQRTVVE
jgi:hypothetical protein